MRIIILGNGVAGITTAKTVRELRPDVEIIVFAEEKYHYYSRPQIIEFLSGKVDDKGMIFYPEDWYSKNKIKVHLGVPAEKIDAEEKRVLVGDVIWDYDSLVIATGAKAFMPPFKGLPKKNVMTLRNLDDAKLIRSLLPKVRNVVIIGGGLLGLETARALSQAKSGLNMRILEKADYLLSRQLDKEGGGIIRALIEEMGTDVFTNVEVEEILGTDSVERVRLKDGRELEANLVIVSAGVRPNLELAKKSGLNINRGLIVDASLCCNRNAMIFAAGDVVEFEGGTYGIVPAALDQAKIVSKMILEMETPEYRGTIASNTLKVMGIDLTSIGVVNPPADGGFEEIRAKSDNGRIYKKFVLKDGKMVGAIILGSRKEVPRVSKMIKEGTVVAGLKARMRQTDFDFSGL
ncbi:MAG: FAD-dependent oxidoreductase [Thermoplasmata archaeon]|nr:FAD-dependent oxidoreductase [Thermoplasmata archaeon]